jgi:hypothetical protein
VKILGENHLLFVNQTRARQDMSELGMHHLVAYCLNNAVATRADLTASIKQPGSKLIQQLPLVHEDLTANLRSKPVGRRFETPLRG